MTANVHLEGFDLPQEESERLNKVVTHYSKKIQEQSSFEVLEITLKKSLKGNAFHHDVKGRLKTKGKILSAESIDFNIFKAVSQVLEKILHEAQHLKRTSRQFLW